MGADLDGSVSVKILFDKEKNQVVCAEADSDFIDILFGFLTLPMGTIIRLVQKQKPSESSHIGCIRNLYQSVEDFSLENFSTSPCKDMLMYPKNPLEATCKDLKVKIDDTPVKYFLCADVACRDFVSHYKNVKCKCGKLLNREVFGAKSKTTLDGEGDKVDELSPRVGVFVKRSTTYFITDNMKVMRGTPGALLELLRQGGIGDVSLVEEKVLKVGVEEVLNLLVHTFVSKTPLTDTFLPAKNSNCKRTPGSDRNNQVTSNGTSIKDLDPSVEIILFISKSDKKPLYVEAMEEFVELLFGFLTFPLSNVVSCLSGDSSLECVDNLYKSVQDLDNKWFSIEKKSGRTEKPASKVELLNPGVASNFKSSSEKFEFCDIRERGGNRLALNKDDEVGPANLDTLRSYCERGRILRIMNPRKGEYCDLGFVKRPAMFIVTDSLVIKPCNKTTSSISFLKDLNVPIDDIEERMVKVSKQEVLSILKASLSTNSALAPLLELLSKKRKRERSEIILD